MTDWTKEEDEAFNDVEKHSNLGKQILKDIDGQPYHWNIDACKEYVKQLRDKTRANTAEHAAEAIEFLLTECDALHKEIDGNHAMLERQTARIWVGLTDEEIWGTVSRIGTSDSDVNPYAKLADARAIEAKLKEKNT